MTRFNLDDYEPVASRVQRFHGIYSNGAIQTEIVFDDGNRIVVKCSVWRDMADPMPAAVDYAEEMLTDRGVNSTSRIENACTSAVGRALAIAAQGLAPSDVNRRPSREEMAKVERREQTPTGPRSTGSSARPVSEKQREALVRMHNERRLPLPDFDTMTMDQASALFDELKAMPKAPKGDVLTKTENQELALAAAHDVLMGDEEPF